MPEWIFLSRHMDPPSVEVCQPAWLERQVKIWSAFEEDDWRCKCLTEMPHSVRHIHFLFIHLFLVTCAGSHDLCIDLGDGGAQNSFRAQATVGAFTSGWNFLQPGTLAGLDVGISFADAVLPQSSF